MLRSLLSRRAIAIAIAGTTAVLLVGYMVLIFPHRTSLELKDLKHEYVRRSLEVGRVRREHGKSPALSNAEAGFNVWQDETRTRCMQIAASNHNNQAGTTALLMVARRWSDSFEAKEAHAKLLELTETLPMDALGMALNNGSAGSNGELATWRPFAAHLIERVRHEPDHRDSAWVLCQSSCLVNPDGYSATGPCEEFVAIAELIRSKFASRENIQNFCEVVGGNGNASEWALAYESHLREILAVNQDRFVRCVTKFNLASIVRAGGIDRQAEAEKLFEEYLAEFDGQTEHPAQGIEISYRKNTQRILKRMRAHGLGMPAIRTVGGRPRRTTNVIGQLPGKSYTALVLGDLVWSLHEGDPPRERTG